MNDSTTTRPSFKDAILQRIARAVPPMNDGAISERVLPVVLEKDAPVARTDERYLSYSIDISVLAGGWWWEGSTRSRRGLGTLRVPPLPLNISKLDALVSTLGPAYLRVGGSEADKIHYFAAPPDQQDHLVLTREIWDALHLFIERHSLKFVFTAKYGLFKRDQHGLWQGKEIEELLKYSKSRNYRMDVCELGNEINAYWAFHGIASQPRAAKLAADYGRFRQRVRQYFPDARILGPGSAFWPRLGEALRPFSNLTQKFLAHCERLGTRVDILDWHYYPLQSDRAPIRTRSATIPRALDYRALNDFGHYAKQLRKWRDRYCPEAELWTGESGSAQCGGQPKLSDRYASCFWWADQLGLGAKLGMTVMIRQSLIGGDYGMIDRLTLKPRPDYWLSWLWKRLMGTDVFEVSSPDPHLRAYCHSTPGVTNSKTLLLINLSAQPRQLEVTGMGKLDRQYTMTAKRLKSRRVRINGVKARFRKGQFSLQDFDVAQHTFTLPGFAIGFWLFRK